MTASQTGAVAINNGTLTSGTADLVVIQNGVTAGGNLTINSQITGSGIALTKSGGGRLILTNSNNSYSGTTYVNAGQLQYGASMTPSSTSAVVASGAAVELANGVTVTGQTITINGGLLNPVEALRTVSGAATWAGNVVLGDLEATLGSAAGTLTVSGNISNGPTVNGIPSNKLWIINNGGTGMTILSGVNNTYTGPTSIVAGTLQITANNILPTGTVLNVHSGEANDGTSGSQATFDMNGYSQQVAALQRTDTTGNSFVTNNNPGTVSTLSVIGPASTTFSGVIQDGVYGQADGITGRVALLKGGTGNLALTGANNYSGGTTLAGGVLVVGNASALGSQTLDNPLTVNGGTLDMSGAGNLNVGAFSGTGGLVTDNGTAAGTTTLSTFNNSNATFAGTISDGATRPVAFLKSGTGTLTLSNSQNFTGALTVNNGTLQLTSLKDNSSVGPINLSTGGPATLRFIGANATLNYRVVNLAASATIDASGSSLSNTFLLAASPNSVTASGSGQNLTLTGATGGFNAGGEIGTSMNLGTGSVTKNGPGTWALDVANSYSGGTVLNAGTLILSNGTTGSALGSGNLTINGGTLATNGGASISGSILSGSGPFTIAPGVRGVPYFAPYADLTVGGLTLASSQATLHFDLGAPVASTTYGGDLISITSGGPLSLAANTTLAISYTTAPVVGNEYRLLADSNSAALATAASDLLLPQAPTGLKYTLSATADSGYLDLLVVPSITTPSFTLSASAAAHTIISGGTSSIAVTLANAGGGAQPDTIVYTGLSASTGANGTISGAASGNAAPLSSGSAAVAFTSSTPGSYTITPSYLSVSGSNGTTPIFNGPATTDTVNVQDHALPNYTAVTLDFGTIHAGYAGTPTSNSFTVSNGTLGDYRANLKASSGTTSYGVSLNSLSGIAVSSSGTVQATLPNGVAGGTLLNQTVSYTFGDDSTVSGNNPALSTASIAVTGQVYSGRMVYSGSGGNSFWSTGNNWNDSAGTVVHAAPGNDPHYTATDSATFDGGTSGGTITLDNASPSLAAITFSNSNANYSIAQGLGGTLTLNGSNNTTLINSTSGMATVAISGTQTISAPILLSTSAAFVPDDTGLLNITGNIGDNGNKLALVLAASGALQAGSLILSGTSNSYTGGTYVESGTLYVTNTGAIDDGSSLIVGAGGIFLYDPTAGGAANAPAVTEKASDRSLAPVPEPGTLALLSVAGIVAAAAVWRRRRNRGN